MRDRLLAFSLSLFMISLSIGTLFFVIRPAYFYIPITNIPPEEADITHKQNYEFVEGLHFVGYDLPTDKPKAGHPLTVALYWQALLEIDRDFLFKLCLENIIGVVITCQRHYPLDGRYPTTVWEVGYVVQDTMTIRPPSCLATGTYTLNLSILPLRSDQAAATIDRSVVVADQLKVGAVSLTSPTGPAEDSFLVCTDGRCTTEETSANQQRQTMSIIRAPVTLPGDIHLINSDSSERWSPLEPGDFYTCSNGETIATHDFILDATIQSGTYYVEAAQQSLPNLSIAVENGDRNFDPPLDMQQEAGYLFGDELKLLGYEVDLKAYLPGSEIKLMTYWQALTTMRNDYFASLHLLDNQIKMWSQDDNPLGDSYMNIFWSPGEVVTDVHHIKVKDETPPGLYNIELGLYDYNLGNFQFLPVSPISKSLSTPLNHLILGQVRVLDPDHAQTPKYPIDVMLGNQIQLLGYDLAPETLTPGEPLVLTLYWQSENPTSLDYTVFTQLIGPNGQVWAQHDSQPQQGRFPTSRWESQDRIVDRYALTINLDAPPGQYHLIIGMYNFETGERLIAVNESGTPVPSNAVILKEMRLN